MAVLLVQHGPTAFAGRFAHRADILANGWFDVGPTPLAQQALHMSTILF